MGRPGHSTKLIGVTGTNGKTTTTSYINSILKAAGKRTALTTTVNYEIDGRYEKNKKEVTSGTTKEQFEFIKKADAAQVDYAIIEVTSQALQQHRHWGLSYEVVGMTNLSYEHMEYHKTMDAYAAAKAILFTKNPSVAALNVDDEWFEYFSDKVESDVAQFNYGKDSQATAQITNIRANNKQSHFNLKLGEDTLKITTHLVGEYNIYNAACAAAMCYGLGISPEDIEKGIADLQWVDGRMNRIDEGQDFNVFVDYAHTPDGLEQVLKTLKDTTKGRLIVLQSAMDGRDPNKWPLLGEKTAQYADHIFVCDEEAFKLPREVMRQAIIDGITSAGGADKYTEIEDRQEAIEAAVAMAQKDDTVLLVPFGHYTEMTFYDKTYHWDERDVAVNAIHKVQGKPHKSVMRELVK
jgi:UDP-N-acetylmuramoyl-L-alanyl-D-glutamate--2,6-diaminopimelate ligase